MKWRLLVMLAVAAAALGCSGKYPVKGKVQFNDGTPLAGGLVIFEDEKGLSSGYSELGPDGSFEITFDEPLDGLPKGNYRVAVRPPSQYALTEDQKKTALPLGGIAQKYLHPETSGILVKIEGARSDLIVQLEKDRGTTRKTSP
jgi:hypothetical protein